MAAPQFSVVIPTRERARTLRFTLRTCLEQDFDDYEIVVCDNFSSPATLQVVEELASSRIRYVRSARPLSMSANWELAVSHARGEYVLVLGDDDGLLFHALRELNLLIESHHAKLIRWTAAFYTWPDIALPGQGDYLRIPIRRQVRTASARPAIAAVIDFQKCYSTLPMLYNSAVHRDLISDLRTRTGRVFANSIPDVYTGFALAWVAQSYLSLDAPMTVAGSSGGSYGIANLFLRGKSPLDREFREFNERERLLTHPWVPDIAIFPTVPVADSFLTARKLLFPGEADLLFDRRRMVQHYLNCLRVDGEDSWRAALRIIRATFDDDPESQAWLDLYLREQVYKALPPIQMRSPYLGIEGDFLHLDVDRFGVADVFAAAELCEKILRFRSNGVRYEQHQEPEMQPLTDLEVKPLAAVEAHPHAAEEAHPHVAEEAQPLADVEAHPLPEVASSPDPARRFPTTARFLLWKLRNIARRVYPFRRKAG